METNIKNPKLTNLIVILLVLLGAVYLIIRIWYDTKTLGSPFLPKYTFVFIYRMHINVMCFVLAALIPAVFLRIRKKYAISTLVILMFFLIGLILKEEVLIYQHFYALIENLY